MFKTNGMTSHLGIVKVITNFHYHKQGFFHQKNAILV